jgi:hypothetical protein
VRGLTNRLVLSSSTYRGRPLLEDWLSMYLGIAAVISVVRRSSRCGNSRATRSARPTRSCPSAPRLRNESGSSPPFTIAASSDSSTARQIGWMTEATLKVPGSVLAKSDTLEAAHAPHLQAAPTTDFQSVEAVGEIEEIGEGEACSRRQLTVFPVPRPPVLIAAEAKPLPDLDAYSSENNGRGDAPNLIDHRGDTRSRARPIGARFWQHGSVGGHDAIDFRGCRRRRSQSGRRECRAQRERIADGDGFPPRLPEVKVAQCLNGPVCHHGDIGKLRRGVIRGRGLSVSKR